jgi:hypothetical protein
LEKVISLAQSASEPTFAHQRALSVSLPVAQASASAQPNSDVDEASGGSIGHAIVKGGWE